MVKIMQKVFEEFDVDFFITPTLGGLPKRRMPGDDKYMPNDLDYTLKMILDWNTMINKGYSAKEVCKKQFLMYINKYKK